MYVASTASSLFEGKRYNVRVSVYLSMPAPLILKGCWINTLGKRTYSLNSQIKNMEFFVVIIYDYFYMYIFFFFWGEVGLIFKLFVPSPWFWTMRNGDFSHHDHDDNDHEDVDVYDEEHNNDDDHHHNDNNWEDHNDKGNKGKENHKMTTATICIIDFLVFMLLSTHFKS